MKWQDCIESTGEVPATVVSDQYGIDLELVLAHAADGHGARFVGGTSKYLIWKEDAQQIDHLYRGYEKQSILKHPNLTKNELETQGATFRGGVAVLPDGRQYVPAHDSEITKEWSRTK